MSILDRLSVQVPKCQKGSPINPQYQITMKYMADIEKAKELGYSWTQICPAVAAEAKELGLWNDDWRTYAIEELYRKIKKEQAIA